MTEPRDCCDHCGSPLDERPWVALDRERLHVVCMTRRNHRSAPYGALEAKPNVRPFWEPAG